MEFNASTANLLKIKADSLILPTGLELTTTAKEIDDALDGAITSLIESKDFTGKTGQCSLLHRTEGHFKRIVLVGIDSANTTQKVISAVESAATVILKTPSKKAVWVADGLSNDHQWLASIVARSFSTATYAYAGTGIKPTPKTLKALTFWSAAKKDSSAAKTGLAYGTALGNGMNVARQLGNLPANICTPNYLASQAKKLAKDQPNLTTTVLKEADMKELKMGSLLSVSAGSVEPANLIVMNYKGAASNVKPIVLVGKAVTFDTGGISLKPGRGMDEMKFDMCGGASVFGVINALLATNLSVNVIGIVPAVENMPAGNATKPGDVVTSMSGQTIEVLNTDAEGRLILCDALTYAGRFKPDTVIDIATLTGAVIGALGKVTSGLLSNDDDLAEQLLDGGTRSGDRAWRLPLWEEYDKQIESNFADMANIGGEAGTITAACFLSRFTKSYKWAHLDIAGTAWLSGAQKGATGRPVPMLMEYIRSKASEN
jgi:leucyl aminopeptidase